MYCGFAFDGVISLVVPEKGSGCSEHTSLASTATDRSVAQNNCAPKSRDPCIVFACDRKSSLDKKISASDLIAFLIMSINPVRKIIPSHNNTYYSVPQLILVLGPVSTLQARFGDTKSPVEDISGLIQAIHEGCRPGIWWFIFIGVEECHDSLGQHSFQEVLFVELDAGQIHAKKPMLTCNLSSLHNRLRE